MIDGLCSNFPYYLLIGSFTHAIVFNRGKHIKYLPSHNSFFFHYLTCCIISVLIKYPFNGNRPLHNNIPQGWYKLLSLPPVYGYTRTVVYKYTSNILHIQPTLDILNIPISISSIKNRYFSSGTPSSHSIISGYLISILYRYKYNKIIVILPILIPISRVMYKHHYTYQVVMGLIMGYLWELLFYYYKWK
ncbi:hypothetical protein NEIRO03_1749 [Nematocida sp. AWRm78]|nr:hypothetical protein NEIRO02_1775 [Nematocida sp. AWRm79]KAI5184472.1 hypothetical protein NEIRO03_1749 [Nematocida sp. AWRm78]